MTKEEYKKYKEQVEAFFKKEGINSLSLEDHQADPYFSWKPCECCKRSLAGDRYDCSGYNPTSEQVQGVYIICVDCIFYNEYGQLDDQTMLDMEK